LNISVDIMDPTVSTALEELRSLVVAVMHVPSGSQEQRAAAERRLLALQKDESRWRLHLQVLYLADSDVVFFIAQGLRQFVWSHWRELSLADKEYLTQGVVECIRRPSDLTIYGRSKLEQILSSVCIMSGTLDPVLGLVVEASQPGVEVGASALRTVLEEVLSEDNKLSADQRKALVAAASSVAVPAATLACQICHGIRASGAPDGPLIMTAIDLLRVLVSKLPIGPHLSASVLQTLCSLAERAIYIDEKTRLYAPTTRGSGGPSCRNEAHSRSAIAALGVLNELMGKEGGVVPVVVVVVVLGVVPVIVVVVVLGGGGGGVVVVVVYSSVPKDHYMIWYVLISIKYVLIRIYIQRSALCQRLRGAMRAPVTCSWS
jgi:hypothetical protein